VHHQKKVRIDEKYIEGFLFDLGIIVLGNKNDVEFTFATNLGNENAFILFQFLVI
jgi:hypothetical protein